MRLTLLRILDLQAKVLAPMPFQHLGHQGHQHRFSLSFCEDQYKHPDHGHQHAAHSHAVNSGSDYQDAHKRAHAEEIKRRVAGRLVSNGPIARVGVGVIAACDARRASQCCRGLNNLARKLPDLSSALMFLVCGVMATQAWLHLSQ